MDSLQTVTVGTLDSSWNDQKITPCGPYLIRAEIHRCELFRMVCPYVWDSGVGGRLRDMFEEVTLIFCFLFYTVVFT